MTQDSRVAESSATPPLHHQITARSTRYLVKIPPGHVLLSRKTQGCRKIYLLPILVSCLLPGHFAVILFQFNIKEFSLYEKEVKTHGYIRKCFKTVIAIALIVLR